MAIKPPTVLQAFIITLCGGALAFLGCAGVITAMSRQHAAGRAAWLMLQIGGVVFTLGALYLGVFVVKAIWQSVTRNRQQGRQPPDPPAGSPEV